MSMICAAVFPDPKSGHHSGADENRSRFFGAAVGYNPPLPLRPFVMPAADKKSARSSRFASPLTARARRFNASVSFDRRLAHCDIRASIAHAKMLARQKIVAAKDARAICAGLKKIEAEIDSGKFEWREADEDVHFNIERRLIEIVGDAGKRLHTARSRNDQVAAALRLFARAQIDDLTAALAAARAAFLTQAKKHAATPMPGFTHLQIAQPVSFGHHLMAYDAMLARDMARLADCRARLNVSPLGAGALGGLPYPLDRRFVARELGFDGVCQNSIDAVSDRDFAVEFAFCCSLMMIHFSRFAEEVVLWMTPAFDFVRLPDSLCTGSSIMPQKKNPDLAELVRGKSGRVVGALVALLTILKSQPLAYNKDNQEDKPPLFDCADAAVASALVVADLARELRANKAAMRRMLDLGFSTATELADFLVANGMAFKDAHAAVAALARAADNDAAKIDSEMLRRALPPAVDLAAARAALDPARALSARQTDGSTAPAKVRAAVEAARADLRRRSRRPKKL